MRNDALVFASAADPASSRSPYPAGVFGFHGAAYRLGQAAGCREAEPDAGTVA
jgi:hypothetical protein